MAKTDIAQMTETLKIKLDYEQLTNCMRCGFCLPACPTFAETGLEAESPRGRIALMKAVVDGLMEPDQMFEEQMNHCLGCRACEPACPAGVKYGQLIEQARDAIEDHTTSHRLWVKGVRNIVLKKVFPKQSRMKAVGATLRFVQATGLNKFARSTGLMKLFPESVREMEKIMPEASAKGVVERIGTVHRAKGAKLGTTALFRGCIMDVMFAETNVRTVELLTAAGFEVVIPQTQNCCGALHAHSGEAEEARKLARSNIAAFKEAGVDYIVSNAGGCGALLIEYDHLLHDDPAWAEDAAWFARRVIDVSELIVKHGRKLVFVETTNDAGVVQTGAVVAGTASIQMEASHEREVASAREARGTGGVSTSEQAQVRVTYQDSCHLRNVMKSPDSPRKLLRQAAGSCFVEMQDADRCCGSAGIYNITQPEMAGQILAHKMEHANAVAPTHILTSNPGCLLQMKLGVEKHGDSKATQTMHIVDFLHERLVGAE